ncbi:MAG: hypothetical protein ACRET8_12220 [Burkholderiales bacterium]
MKISILYYYFDTLRTLDCFRKLDGHDVTIHNEYEIQFSDIFDQIVAYAKGTPINVVNPQVFVGVRMG